MLTPTLLVWLLASLPVQWDPQPGDPVATVQVVDESGEPLIGAEVYVESEPRWGWDGKSYEFVPTAHDPRTDDEGRFRFDPSAGVQYWIGITPAREAMVLFAFDRDTLRQPGGAVCRLRPIRSLSGRLLDHAGSPVVQRAVHLVAHGLPRTFLAPVLPPGSIMMECEDVGYAVAMNGPTGHPFESSIQSTATDEEGRFSFRARTIRVDVVAADADGVVQSASRVLDEPEEELEFRFQELDAGTCEVNDHEGNPLAGAVVFVARGDGWGDHSALCPVGVSDEDGRVRFASLAGDMSGVAVRHPEFSMWVVDDFHGERFDPGEPIVFPPMEAAAKIRLPVSDLAGKAVDSARFRTLPQTSELPGMPWFELEEQLRALESRQVEFGIYEILADPTSVILVDSAQHAPQAVLPIESEVDGEELAAVLHPGRRYAIRVLENGVPVRGAVIAPEERFDFDTYDEDQAEAHEACGFAMFMLWNNLLTDADGRWTSPVVCAQLQLDFSIQHWDGRKEVLLLPADPWVEVEFGGPLVALTGRIVQDGVPLEGCELVISECWTDSTSTEIRVLIGDDGEFAAKVHPGVELALAVNDHPELASYEKSVGRLPGAGEVGTIEANDLLPKPVQAAGRVTVRFPSTKDGFQPSIRFDLVPKHPEDLTACGDKIHGALLVNDRGESGAYLPAGSLTVRLDWPGPSFRLPHTEDYVTNAYSAVGASIELDHGQVLDLTETVENLIRQLEAWKVE